jgi:hypothetical protein
MPCEDAFSVALIRPFQIKHYGYVWWQGTVEVQECMEGIFKILLTDPSICLLQQHELDQILGPEEAPTSRTRSRHFPQQGTTGQQDIPTCYGP